MIASAQLIQSLLFEVPPNDLSTLAIVVAVVVGTALAATYLPARRASRVEPTEALRAD